MVVLFAKGGVNDKKVAGDENTGSVTFASDYVLRGEFETADGEGAEGWTHGNIVVWSVSKAF